MIYPSSRHRFSRTESSGRKKFSGTVIVAVLLLGAAVVAFFLLRHPLRVAQNSGRLSNGSQLSSIGGTGSATPSLPLNRTPLEAGPQDISDTAAGTQAATLSDASATGSPDGSGTNSASANPPAAVTRANQAGTTASAVQTAAKSDYPTLWKAQHYLELIQATDRVLQSDPMDPTALVYNGFANFYYGITQVVADDKQSHLENSITSLRRVLLVLHPPYLAEVHYVLGKAYYQVGLYYSDLAINNLQEALTLGYTAPDIYEYLGLSYSRIGLYQKAVDSFLKAISQNPKDVLYYTVAQTYDQMQDYGNALLYAQKAIDTSNDDFLVQKSRFLLGDVYLAQKQYDQAQQEYNKILEASPQSADAHYYLGEVYAAQGDRVAARHEWVQAIRIDPNNALAAKRLGLR